MSTVTAITPNLGAVGDSVTITGTGFGAAQGGSTVSFGGVAVASYTSWSDTSIVVVVPAATPSGRVVVTVSGAVQADYKASWFEIRDSTCLSLYDAINGRLKAQDETNDSSPEDYRAADARDYNNLLHIIANILEGPGKSFMSGLRLMYSSATAITVEAGSAMSSTGKHLLSLAALSTISIATAGAALGLDETTLTATATTSNGSASVTMSASLWVETPMTNTVRTLSGTITSVGTALTGASSKFLSELAIGDVVRSSANGASRVTAIASDTAATLVAAFPGGNVTGVAGTSYDNLTFWCNTSVAADKFAINTVSHAGTAIVMSSTASGGGSEGAGKTAKVGVEIASRWYFPWLVYGSSGTTVILSTQRTRPYGVTGYTTAWRRVPCAVRNNASGNLTTFYDVFGGAQRYVSWDDSADGEQRLLSGGTATSFTAFSTDGGAPPTSTLINVAGWLFGAQLSPSANQAIYLRPLASAAPNYLGNVTGWAVNAAGQNHGSAAILMPNRGSAAEYKLSGTPSAGTPGYVDTLGFWETA